jgi:hypothetical protein
MSSSLLSQVDDALLQRRDAARDTLMQLEQLVTEAELDSTSRERQMHFEQQEMLCARRQPEVLRIVEERTPPSVIRKKSSGDQSTRRISAEAQDLKKTLLRQ